jgi:hypothetical protein
MLRTHRCAQFQEHHLLLKNQVALLVTGYVNTPLIKEPYILTTMNTAPADGRTHPKRSIDVIGGAHESFPPRQRSCQAVCALETIRTRAYT